jgi:polysaccharide biosynthesis/export protein
MNHIRQLRKIAMEALDVPKKAVFWRESEAADRCCDLPLNRVGSARRADRMPQRSVPTLPCGSGVQSASNYRGIHPLNRPKVYQVLECASPLALWPVPAPTERGRGLPQSKTLSRERPIRPGFWSRGRTELWPWQLPLEPLLQGFARPISFFCCLLLLVVAGCKSSAARFDARQPSAESKSSEPPLAFSHKLFPLENQAFTAVEITNRIRPEWLKPPAGLFELGPGDVIEIETMEELNARSTAIVGPDGKIYYGLLPGTFVWGLTLSEAKDLIEKNLAKFLRVQPDMTLNLKTVGSKQVWLLGSLQSPGVFPLGAPITLLEAISAAGGPLTIAGSSEEPTDLQSSFVLRQGQLLGVDFYRLLRKGDLTQNIYLQPDDFVYLRSSVAKNVYVMGAVGQANAIPYSEKTSLVAAISASGGTVDYAYLSQVAIIRGSLTEPRIATVDYRKILKGQLADIRLEAGDIVYVPFVPWQKLSSLADSILRDFVSTVALNEGVRAVAPGAAPVGVTVPGGFSTAP